MCGERERERERERKRGLVRTPGFELSLVGGRKGEGNCLMRYVVLRAVDYAGASLSVAVDSEGSTELVDGGRDQR